MKPSPELTALRTKVQWRQKNKRMTQAQHAKIIGVSPQQLGQVLKGDRPLTMDMLSYIGYEKVVRRVK